jgi:hypothetical protein
LKINAEGILSILIITAFILTSIIVYATGGNSLTREEAIEISRNATIVQTALNEGKGMLAIEANHWTAAYIRSLEGKYPGDVYEKLPQGHGVWRVCWDITPPGYQILHFIDELTGEILYENWFLAG